MKQLELFPENDIVRFAMSLSMEEYAKLKSTRPDDYHRIRGIRCLIQRHNADLRRIEKNLAYELERAIM